MNFKQVPAATPTRAIIEIIGLALLYFVTARIGQLLAIPPGNVTPVWIPSGIILVAVLLRGYSIWPGVWLGAFMGNVWAYLDWAEFSNLGLSITSGVANGVGDTLCAVVGARLILGTTNRVRVLDSVFHVFQFVLYGALLGGAISAVFGVTGLAVAGFIPWQDYTTVWLTWWVGDAVGVLLVAPLLLTLKDWVSGGGLNRSHAKGLLLYSFVLIVVAGLSLGLVPSVELSFPLFMVLPVLLWGVYSFPRVVAIGSVVLIAAAAIIATANGLGSFAGSDVNKALLDLQLFSFTVMSTIYALVGVVGERQKIEEGVELSQQRYKRLFDQSAGGIIITDEHGRIESFNAKASEIFGYDEDEVVGRNVSYLVPTSIKHRHQEFVDNYQNYQGASIFSRGTEVKGRHKNGSEVPLYLALSTDRNRHNQQFLAVVHDISDRKKVEEDLKASEEKFRLLANSSFEALIVISKNVVLSVNEPFQRLFGYDAEDLVGKPLKKKLFTTDLVFLEGSGEALQSEGIKKQGLRFPVEVQQKTELINNDILKVISIRDRSKFHEQQRELELARDQAENASRQKSRFLFAMGQELRPPIDLIQSNLGYLSQSDVALAGEQKDSIVAVNSAAKGMLSLIDDILDLSKIESGSLSIESGSVDLYPMIESCVSILKPQADERGIKIFNHLGEQNYQVIADSFRLKQVLLNIFSNAIKFNHADGTVSVSAEPASNNRIRISVVDSGVGLSPEDQERVFRPFERVQVDGSGAAGTGIGLVISKALVEMMGGTIGVESYKFIGSTFWVELQLAEKEEV